MSDTWLYRVPYKGKRKKIAEPGQPVIVSSSAKRVWAKKGDWVEVHFLGRKLIHTQVEYDTEYIEARVYEKADGSYGALLVAAGLEDDDPEVKVTIGHKDVTPTLSKVSASITFSNEIMDDLVESQRVFTQALIDAAVVMEPE